MERNEKSCGEANQLEKLSLTQTLPYTHNEHFQNLPSETILTTENDGGKGSFAKIVGNPHNTKQSKKNSFLSGLHNN